MNMIAVDSYQFIPQISPVLLYNSEWSKKVKISTHEISFTSSISDYLGSNNGTWVLEPPLLDCFKKLPGYT